MGKENRVLVIGGEGGGLMVFRTPLGKSGWQFHIAGPGIDPEDFPEENDHVGWQSWTTESFPTILDALRSAVEDDYWALWYPTFVHPEYRNILWKLCQETASNLPEEVQEIWRNRNEVWKQLCLEQSEN